MYVVQTFYLGEYLYYKPWLPLNNNVSSIDFFVIICADKLIGMQYLQQYCIANNTLQQENWISMQWL